MWQEEQIFRLPDSPVEEQMFGYLTVWYALQIFGNLTVEADIQLPDSLAAGVRCPVT
jgi:hypothetical protein